MEIVTPETIAESLKQDILAGRIPARAELRQAAIADRFGVSRIPVRDALRSLASEGLAVIVPGRGATVISLTAEEIEEIFDMRMMLECDCLERAAAAIDEEALQRIERVRRKSHVDANTPSWSDSDWAFHLAIYELSGRQRQIAIIKSLRQTCRVAAAGYDTLPEANSRWLADHKEIVDLLGSGSVMLASAALRAHLEGARNSLVARLSSSGPA